MKFLKAMAEAFEAASVQYVVVGGLATILHGHARLTADVDIVLSLEEENVKRAMAAMSKLGFVPRIPVSATDFANASTREMWIRDKGLLVFSMYHPADPLSLTDFFVEEPLPFDDLLKGSVQKDLGDFKIRIVSIAHLIYMKTRAGRPKDLEDIKVLNQLKDHE